jgi:hypothetical protein
LKHICLNLTLLTSLFAYEPTTTPSYQGFRGAINTPNAKTIGEGTYEFMYTNQIENFTPSSSSDYRDDKVQKNFFLNIGLLPNLDINFQYADIEKLSKRGEYFSDDRVVGVKYQLDFIPNNLFDMAIGMQDIAGGNPYLGSEYLVASKEFNSFSTSIGYAKGENTGSIDGLFGSIEYQPLSWLQLVGEYDTHEWNGAIKGELSAQLGEQQVNLGIMAKSSLDYNDVYFGIYANMPFNNKALPKSKTLKSIHSKITLNTLQLSNSYYHEKNNIAYFEYENNLYVYSDIDTLGIVLGTLTTTTKATTIQVSIKKSNMVQYTIEVNRDEYKKFLKDGIYHSNLLHFIKPSSVANATLKNSDKFKPLLKVSPDMLIIDGSEYSDVLDYTFAMKAELSMRLARGTIISGQYYIPLTQSFNFEKDGVFSYRNRHKTSAEVDQLLLTQYANFNIGSLPWLNMIQAGMFDNKQTGVSFESAISSPDGKHLVSLKVAKLDDKLKNMDRYTNDTREEKLLSYRYYIEPLNSNIKLTAGEFIYGDTSEVITLERYFNDLSFKFDLAHTKHDKKGENNFFRFSLSIPFGPSKRFKSDYLDVEGGKLVYNKIKNIVSGDKRSYVLPHHVKKIDNSFGIENYYLNDNRFHPSYIKANYNRLRNVFID